MLQTQQSPALQPKQRPPIHCQRHYIDVLKCVDTLTRSVENGARVCVKIYSLLDVLCSSAVSTAAVNRPIVIVFVNTHSKTYIVCCVDIIPALPSQWHRLCTRAVLMYTYFHWLVGKINRLSGQWRTKRQSLGAHERGAGVYNRGLGLAGADPLDTG